MSKQITVQDDGSYSVEKLESGLIDLIGIKHLANLCEALDDIRQEGQLSPKFAHLLEDPRGLSESVETTKVRISDVEVDDGINVEEFEFSDLDYYKYNLDLYANKSFNGISDSDLRFYVSKLLESCK